MGVNQDVTEYLHVGNLSMYLKVVTVGTVLETPV